MAHVLCGYQLASPIVLDYVFHSLVHSVDMGWKNTLFQVLGNGDGESTPAFWGLQVTTEVRAQEEGEPSQGTGPRGLTREAAHEERGPEPEGEDRPAGRLARLSRAGTGQ